MAAAQSILRRCACRPDYTHLKATREKLGMEDHGRKGNPDCIYFPDPAGHQLQHFMPNE